MMRDRAASARDASNRPRKRLTVREYMMLPESNMPTELIDGELIREPAPTTDHQTIVGDLFLRFSAYVRDGGLGKLYFSPVDVVLGDNVVQPDLLFIAKERLSLVQKKGRIDGAPDLVVEILSPGTAKKDRHRKRAIYAENGVHEYWIVDPATREAEVLQLADNEYHVFSRLSRDGELTSAVLPGIQLRPTEIFGYGT